MAQTNGVTPMPQGMSTLDELTAKIGSSSKSLRQLLRAIKAPLPTQTGDGSQLPEPERPNKIDQIQEVWRDLNALGIKNVTELVKVAEQMANHEPMDDKKYEMEHLIQAAAILPDDVISEKITGSFVTQLWKDLDHPPQTLLGEEQSYRQPDGSGNNYQIPHLGAAGMPYARTVSPKTMSSGAMPDPGVLFDTVMARKDQRGLEHPNKISSILFNFASIIIHDVFKTNRDDYNISDTSSYLDLSPLYGSTWAEQKRMRTSKDGKIKPDCFSETRLLTFPPGVGAILIMFNRHHNWVAEQLASINEGGRFTVDPRKVTVWRYGEKINKRDDDLFQTARLITCGLYCNIVLIDYVRTILNLNRTDENWQLNPRMDMPGGPPRGQGNQVSAEFNLVYRWHAATSAKDDAWTRELFKEIVEEPLDITAEAAAKPENIYKFLGILAQLEAKALAVEPDQRPFPALKAERLERIKDGPFQGNFQDNDLAKILVESIEDCANAMGPQQVPTVMKAIEVLGIKQARTWKMSTLNEFRKHFALEPHRKFSDITDNVEVQEALKHLYGEPDNVELYPGLVVEDAKQPKLPGSGLCPSFTTSRGVLSDATALVRGDRYYTTSYTPAALTNWGYQQASSDLTIDNGCVMYKLFLRALPNNFDPASVYVHYPMTIPQGQGGMQETLERLGKAHKYDMARPTPIVQPTIIFSYEAAQQIMLDQDNFKVTWGKAIEFLLGDEGKNFCLAGDDVKNAESRNLMEKALYLGASSRDQPKGNEKWLTAVRDYYEDVTTRLLKEKSYKLAGTNQVDIVRDVGNLANVHFSAEFFSLPLKTADFPRGLFTEHELYLIMAAVFICIFFDADPTSSFGLHQQAHEAGQQLCTLITLMVQSIKLTGKIGEEILTRVMPPSSSLRDYGVHMMAQLLKVEPNVTKLVRGNIVGSAAAMTANQGQLFAQGLDYLFSDAGKQYLPDINRLAKLDTPEADDTLMHYLMEATRLSGEVGVFRWVAHPITITDKTAHGTQVHSFQPGDKILVNLKAASHDPVAFPDPDTLDLTRPLDRYIHFGSGVHQCLGLPMTRVALTTMLKVVGRLDNLRPATVAVGAKSGPASIKKVLKEFVPGDAKTLPESWHYHAYLTEDWDMYFPFPQSLQINFDGPISDVKKTK